MTDETLSPATPPVVEAEGFNGDVATGAAITADQDPKNLWAEKGALVVAGAPKSMPTKNGRQVIIVENRVAPGEDGNSSDDKAKYLKGADVYVGHATVRGEGTDEAGRIFPEAGEGEVVLIGDTILQSGHEGLEKKRGFVRVGPAHPVYAAVNIAYQRGARDVKVVGLREDEIKTLRPWFDAIAPEFDSLEYGG